MKKSVTFRQQPRLAHRVRGVDASTPLLGDGAAVRTPAVDALSNAGHKNSETEEKTGENPGLNGHVSDSGTILNVLGQCDVRMLCAIKTCVLCVLCVLCVCCVNGRNTMV